MKKSTLTIIGGVAAAIVIIAGGFGLYHWYQGKSEADAVQATAQTYTQAFAKRQYDKAVKQVDTSHLTGPGWHYTAKTLAARNQAVFDRVGASDIKVTNVKTKKSDNKTYELTFTANMNTKIGKLSAQHYEAPIVKVGNDWRVQWSPRLLFPSMNGKDTVQIDLIAATRGQIYDRNNQLLAKNGDVTQAGLVPGKLGTGADRTANLEKIAAAWDVKVTSLETLLKQSWVTDDTFVPVKIVTDSPAMTGAAYQTIGSRTYPLGEAAAQLIGYVGTATADDIRKDPTLTANSKIGKTGLEQVYDKRLRGTDGGQISIQNGDNIHPLLTKKAVNGKSLKLTIDANQQKIAYTQLAGKAGSVVTMNPTNGELLTLASSPSYDPNAFVNGISQTDYDKYANNTSLPLLSRFAQRYAPGSTFKMLTAAIALQNKTITPDTTKSISGLKWQKDSSWGDYKVTRTVDAASENMTQALVNSDNIWFAQTALKMGAFAYLKGLAPLFKTQADLPLTMKKAQISNSGKLASETLLADTAYGQGQLLLSPIEQAAMYSTIANGGTMQQPTLIQGTKGKRTSSVLQANAADTVKTALTHVVSDQAGTAHDLAIDGHTIAAKTGTAELKQKQDTDGKENGFLVAMDADKNTYLTVALIEGTGSGDVVTAMKPYVASLY
ncbi:penicillin-binding protein PBP4(5) [Lacticaseibacillus paracasei]|jgi:penicillin-binding protein 3|uniref:Cell division protein FtsI (Peptidoglycansynthetase) n=1 Tax=Lacticaseibacillus paracasei subsp. paracasei Lpp22 TaxID=1256221 RepID=A0A8E0M7C0_LACPA|nr:penicillin-binding transpeptidase domain-containing protein [Lacticaseibacillus paracasei]EKQ24098.1 peptidoglycan synthetase [Lacticaseibacillus casei UW4]EPC33185.1 Cell division protein FtsI (Peptidoglycansynthetase) [Lacticaseibacillus paracasei subsp. paracasei Lpp22]MBB1167045.1 cell division protein FtsI [Lacticaseibacillus paracasei]MCT3344691.1 cell division protein FtsI [Lacticaseibacillus paracasei]MDM7530094.1 penicillin-binding transpeptidase domain-containing protein [Lacticas